MSWAIAKISNTRKTIIRRRKQSAPEVKFALRSVFAPASDMKRMAPDDDMETSKGATNELSENAPSMLPFAPLPIVTVIKPAS